MNDTRQDTTTGWICTDCLMLLANGETPPEMSEEETAEYLARVEEDDCETTLGLLWEEHEEGCTNRDASEWVEECYCDEQTFSWSACDMCRSGLGGARHAVTFWL